MLNKSMTNKSPIPRGLREKEEKKTKRSLSVLARIQYLPLKNMVMNFS